MGHENKTRQLADIVTLLAELVKFKRKKAFLLVFGDLLLAAIQPRFARIFPNRRVKIAFPI